jgi:hypothetical protein
MKPGAVFPIQLGLIALGTMGSIGLLWRMAESDYPSETSRAAAPWALAIVLLAVAAVWILFQPMELRGVASLG